MIIALPGTEAPEFLYASQQPVVYRPGQGFYLCSCHDIDRGIATESDAIWSS